MDLLPLSGLQHFLYCPRQCALIHVEQQWAENRFTAEGNVIHEKAHSGADEHRVGDGIRTREMVILIFNLSMKILISPLASGGVNGLGGSVARVSYTNGDGLNFFELPESGDEAAILGLDGQTRLFVVRNGEVLDPVAFLSQAVTSAIPTNILVRQTAPTVNRIAATSTGGRLFDNGGRR